MKTRITLLLLLLGSFAWTSAHAQEPASEEEATIRSLEEQVRMGVLNRDTLALERLWSEQFLINNLHDRVSGNRVSANRRVVFDLLRQGLIHYSSFEERIERIRIEGDIAIVMGTETVKPMGDEPLAGQTVERRFTHVWQREGGSWRLIARHANVIPQG